jgi:hypothetical protein
MENKDDPSKKNEEKPDSQMQNEQISSSLVNDEEMDDEATKVKTQGSSLIDNDTIMETSTDKNKEVAKIEIRKKEQDNYETI